MLGDKTGRFSVVVRSRKLDAVELGLMSDFARRVQVHVARLVELGATAGDLAAFKTMIAAERTIGTEPLLEVRELPMFEAQP